MWSPEEGTNQAVPAVDQTAGFMPICRHFNFPCSRRKRSLHLVKAFLFSPSCSPSDLPSSLEEIYCPPDVNTGPDILFLWIFPASMNYESEEMSLAPHYWPKMFVYFGFLLFIYWMHIPPIWQQGCPNIKKLVWLGFLDICERACLWEKAGVTSAFPQLPWKAGMEKHLLDHLPEMLKYFGWYGILCALK